MGSVESAVRDINALLSLSHLARDTAKDNTLYEEDLRFVLDDISIYIGVVLACIERGVK